MSQWTESASIELESHLGKIRSDVGGSGADPDEVIADLRMHIENEVASLKLDVVTAEDVRKILGRMGKVQAEVSSNREVAPESIVSRVWSFAKKVSTLSSSYGIPAFGVALPLICLVVEIVTGLCGRHFFDPIPKMGHVLAYLWVGLGAGVGLWTLRSVRQGTCRDIRVASWCVGVSCGISLVYALLFIPLLPISLFAIVFFGLGFCSLSPLISFVITWKLHGKLRRAGVSLGLDHAVRLRRGVLVGVLLMLLIESPGSLTRVGLEMASSDSSSIRRQGISILRAVGDEMTMLKACYSQFGRSMDLLGFLLNLNGSTTTADGRKIFYQVTGKPFNAVEPPLRKFDMWRMDREFEVDQGGAMVGEVEEDLTLAHSSLDASIDADAAVSYTQWTMLFRNKDEFQGREARAQISLPPGSVVSRLTLWINGEEREAAFASRGKTREAYTNIVKKQRDPVLITTDGPDRIILQCFPVPARGEMKVRFGFTTPLVLDSDKNAIQALPKILERNFRMEEGFRHEVWLESKRPLSSACAQLKSENPKEGLYALRGWITAAGFDAHGVHAVADRKGSPDVVWAKDHVKDGSSIIRQRFMKATERVPEHVILVVDGSASMKSHLDSIGKALLNLPKGIRLSVFLANDEVEALVADHDSNQDRTSWDAMFRKMACSGGKDNLPALERAWDHAEGGRNVILWIHASQPVEIEIAEGLTNKFSRRPGHASLIDIQVDVGPNRVAEKLDGLRDVRSLVRLGSLEKDLTDLFTSWSGSIESWTAVREKVVASHWTTSGSKETSSHLVRLWAYDEVLRTWNQDEGRRGHGDNDGKSREEALALAASYQLVTPLTGAVVLETQAQYAEAGLEPVQPGTVPSIPEPETWMMILLVLIIMMVLMSRRRPCAQ